MCLDHTEAPPNNHMHRTVEQRRFAPPLPGRWCAALRAAKEESVERIHAHFLHVGEVTRSADIFSCSLSR
jgi:hypothetical protein